MRSTSPTSRARTDHRYALLGAHEGEEVAHEGVAPDGATVVDGGRTRRAVERFDAYLPQGMAVRGIVRLDGKAGTRVHVVANKRPVADLELGDDEDWVERTFDIPAASGRGPTNVELQAAGRHHHDVPLLVHRPQVIDVVSRG